jgi:hypothetical protein
LPKLSLAPWQYAAVNNPFDHFAMYGGVAVGKSFSGSHFAISMITHHPEMTGFIGANTYDQLSQASLREFFYWLDDYGLDYVVDCKPPPAWRTGRALKTYKNTVHVRNPRTERVTLIFTRVLSYGNPLRGLEFSWYWLDETRDTPEDTHDIILSRMRETPDFAKGIITTTTNGEDWSYRRFVLGADGSKTYGSMHVATVESLKLGIITKKYYETMLKSFSPMMALQELEAQHVNVMGGKAYYAASDKNRSGTAPWGDVYPTRDRPLVIGCDFNFAPAPCVWMVGQYGPPLFDADGRPWSEQIHWFYEVSGREMSTPEMTVRLLQQFPDYFYRIFGDVSGGVGTTSNAGVTDYDQIAQVLTDAGALYTIDRHQADEEESKANPRVRSRVENMNRLLCNAVGERSMTYDPARCPLFDSDMKGVGWKETTSSGRGKLDDGGNRDRTHASDGAGYAVYKLFPPGRRASLVESLPSTVRQEYGIVRDA